ncbi:3-beta hydroxysteroid dehydrogenase, partial [Brucella oryzae]
GHDIVISAYNPGWSDAALREKHLKGSRAITAATRNAGSKRLLAGGGACSLSIDGNQRGDSPEFPAEGKQGALGARQALVDLRGEK